MPAPIKKEGLTAEELRDIAENGLAAPTLVEGVTQDDLNAWYTLDKQLEKVKEQELDLRKKIAKSLFPNPIEGSKNYYGLGNGFELQMKHSINVSVDEDMYRAKKEDFTAAGIPEDVVKWKPSLVGAKYDALSTPQKRLIDKVISRRPGTPALEIRKPKRAK